MDRRNFIKKTSLVIGFSALAFADTKDHSDVNVSSKEDSIPDGRTNIVLIMADQFRPDHLCKEFTPNLWRMADNGVNFTHCYTASPVCQPARVSIVTGLYPSQNHICGNQTDLIADELRDDTFMNHLRNNGYYTAMIGKHHYIDRYGVGLDVVKADKEEVMKYGFDHVVQCLDIGEHASYSNAPSNDDDYINYLREKGLDVRYRDSIAEGVKKGIHPLDADDTEDGFIGNKAVEFINGYDKKQPFYLNVSFIGPHPPYVAPGTPQFLPEDSQPPLGAENNELTKNYRSFYANYCLHIDKYIGKIANELKSRGLYENTVIIFTADHGDNLGDFGIWDKRYFYEQSAGVPLFMAGKGIPTKTPRYGSVVCKALVSTLDLYPTILGIAGIQADLSQRQGRNLIDIINGEKGAFRQAVFSQLATAVMIRTAKWKMVFDAEQGGVWHLYNLVNDPSELNNLAGVSGYESIEGQLKKHLLSFYINLHQFSHAKEQIRLQAVRTPFYE